MANKFLRSAIFWKGAVLSFIFVCLLFAWELGFLYAFGLAGPARPPASLAEIILAGVIAFLFACNVGLLFYRKRHGSCPVGTRAVTGVSGVLGVIALFCPACAFGSLGFLGVTGLLILLSPYAMLIQIVAIILLLSSLILLMR